MMQLAASAIERLSTLAAVGTDSSESTVCDSSNKTRSGGRLMQTLLHSSLHLHGFAG
jgi:hypothetical protein